MNIRLLQIFPLASDIAPSVARPTNNPEYIYTSIAIEEDGHFFYWAKGINVEISKNEFLEVTRNPKLFNESMSYKLHQRIQAKKFKLN